MTKEEQNQINERLNRNKTDGRGDALDAEYAGYRNINLSADEIDIFWKDGSIKVGEGFFPKMNGNFVFKNAIKRFEEVIFESLNYNNYTSKDIDMLITHQANLRITQYIQKKLNIDENNIFNNIMSYGNTTSASIPIALYEALEKNKIKRGDLVCLAAFGSGFTWASALIRW